MITNFDQNIFVKLIYSRQSMKSNRLVIPFISIIGSKESILSLYFLTNLVYFGVLL